MRIGVIISAVAAACLVAVAAGVLMTRKEQADPVSTVALSPGQAVYRQWCLDCHGPLPEPGRGGPGTGFPPAGTLVLEKRYKGATPAVLTDRTDLTEEYVRYMVRNGQGIMPPTRKSEVSDEELDALIGYLVVKQAK